MPEIILASVAMIALVLFRRYAARQVAARRGRFVWAFAFPMVLSPVLMVWAGFQLLGVVQLLGGLLILFGVALGSVELRFFWRAARAVSNLSAQQDVGEALVEPMTDFALVMTVGGLTVAIVGGLGLVVWAVLNQAR